MNRQMIGERYQLLNHVGSGGMADVYRARDLRDNAIVAVKMMRTELLTDTEFVRRFEREAQAQSMLDHKNIVKTLDYGQDGDTPYIVMEFVQGITLKELIAKRAPLSHAMIVDIAQQILSALRHAHSRGLVHRDIKPQNMLVSRDGHLKVTDFGLVKAASSSTITLTGSNVLGSVHYFSPEQARGIASDKRSDLYSLGIILYEMATGQLPYHGDTPVAVALKHLQDVPVYPHLLADVPPALEDIVLKAMLKEPEDRYQSAGQMNDDLLYSLEAPDTHFVEFPEHVAVGLEEGEASREADEMNLPESPPESYRRARFAVTGVAVVLISAALLVVLWVMSQNVFGQVNVPGVVGLSVEEALQELDELKIPYQINEVENLTVPRGRIISQSIEPHTQINRREEILTLVVSSGPGRTTVPSLIGELFDDAMNMLTANELKFGDAKYEVDKEREKDTVIAQTPEAGEVVEKGTKVNLTLSRP
ncbi:MAG: Stk1 family PASTA domain-containing Ser/Thr kinase [Christensenellales bacterium]